MGVWGGGREGGREDYCQGLECNSLHIYMYVSSIYVPIFSITLYVHAYVYIF